MPILLLFVALPLIEIALFVVIGGQIGVLGVLAGIVGSAFVGVSVLRGQQARLMQVRQGLVRLSPATLLAEGAFRLIAGLLLIAPGFLTDALGLLLLIPLVQRLLVAALAARMVVHVSGANPARGGAGDDVIDGTYEVRDADAPRPGHAPLDPDHRLEDRRHDHRRG